VYFFFRAAAEYVRAEHNAGDWVPLIVESVSWLGEFFVGTAYMAWIVFATYTTMMELKSTEQTFKFSQYRTLVVLILGALVVSIVVFMMNSMVEIFRVQDEWFRWWWIWELYWQLVTMVTIVAVCLLFRPNERNELYAHSLQLSQNDQEIELPEKGDDVPVELDPDEPTGKSEKGTESSGDVKIAQSMEEQENKKVAIDLSSSEDLESV